jgi:hypothetical protein
MEEGRVPPSDEQAPSEGPAPSAGQPPDEAQRPSEEELQRQLEEQLSKVRVQDLLLESVAGILNLSARRISKADERDLDQGRIGIEAVRAVVDLLEPAPREQVREALSQVQVLYAREAQGSPGETTDERPGPPPKPPQGERPSGLWTPPGTS